MFGKRFLGSSKQPSQNELGYGTNPQFGTSPQGGFNPDGSPANAPAEGSQGAANFGNAYPGDRGKADAPPPDISGRTLMEIALAAWAIFSIVCLLFGFTYHDSKVEVWSLVFLGAGTLLIIVVLSGRQQNESHTSKVAFIVAAWLLAAVVMGTMVGLFAFDCCIGEYWHSQLLEARENVLPSEAAGAYSTAGEIVFADEARVDASKSVGYKDTSVYCVAPVASDAPMELVQFWAAGIDCCGARGSFVCDDSWNPKAHAGVVINNVSFAMMRQDIRAKYLKAIKLAEVTYAIASAEEPILVRWVADPDQVQLNAWTMGFGILLGAVIVSALICGLQAWAMSCLMANGLGKRNF